MLHYQVASDSPGGATSNVKWVNLHIIVTFTIHWPWYVVYKKSFNYLLWIARYSGKCMTAFFGPLFIVINLCNTCCWSVFQHCVSKFRPTAASRGFPATARLSCWTTKLELFSPEIDKKWQSCSLQRSFPPLAKLVKARDKAWLGRTEKGRRGKEKEGRCLSPKFRSRRRLWLGLYTCSAHSLVISYSYS